MLKFEFNPISQEFDLVDDGSADFYTNPNPTPDTLGGIPAGSSFLNASMKNMWDELLYPYQAPAFSSFLMAAQLIILECGVFVAGGVRTFDWVATNPVNIQANSLEIEDITNSVVLGTGLANDGTEDLDIGAAITKLTTQTAHQWRITGINSQSNPFLRNFNVNWYSPYYYGVGIQGLTVAQIQALTKQVVNKSNKDYVFNPTNEVYYFAYPKSYGLLTSILDTNNFETIADWTVTTKSFTNNSPDYEGTTMDYYVYEFNNPTTQTNFTNHFIY